MFKKLLIAFLVLTILLAGCTSGQIKVLKDLGLSDEQINTLNSLSSSEDSGSGVIDHTNASTVVQFIEKAFPSLPLDKEIQLIVIDLTENTFQISNYTPGQAVPEEEIFRKKPVADGFVLNPGADVFVAVKDPSKPNTTVDVLIGETKIPVKLNRTGVGVVYVPYSTVTSLPKDEQVKLSWTARDPENPNKPLSGSTLVTFTSPRTNSNVPGKDIEVKNLQTTLTLAYPNVIPNTDRYLLTKFVVASDDEKESGCAFPPTDLKPGYTKTYVIKADILTNPTNTTASLGFDSSGNTVNVGSVTVNSASKVLSNFKLKAGANDDVLVRSFKVTYKDSPTCEIYFGHGTEVKVPAGTTKTFSLKADVDVIYSSTYTRQPEPEPTSTVSSNTLTITNPTSGFAVANNTINKFANIRLLLPDGTEVGCAGDPGQSMNPNSSSVIGFVITGSDIKNAVRVERSFEDVSTKTSGGENVSLAKWNFTALSTNNDVKVTSLKVKINGVDTCFSEFPPFKVAPGESKIITLVADLSTVSCEAACIDWSACSNGIQTRTCGVVPVSCPQPETSRSCTDAVTSAPGQITITPVGPTGNTLAKFDVKAGGSDFTLTSIKINGVGIKDKTPFDVSMQNALVSLWNGNVEAADCSSSDLCRINFTGDLATIPKNSSVTLTVKGDFIKPPVTSGPYVVFDSSTPTDSTSACVPNWVADLTTLSPWSGWSPEWPACAGGDQTSTATVTMKETKCGNPPKVDTVSRSRHCKDKKSGSQKWISLGDNEKQSTTYASAIDTESGTVVAAPPLNGIPVYTISFSDVFFAATAKGSSSTPDKRFYHEVDLSTMPSGIFLWWIKDIPMPPEKNISIRIGFGKLGGDKNFALVSVPQFAPGYGFADRVETYDGKNLYLGGRLYSGSLNYTYATPKQQSYSQLELDSKSYWRTGLFILAHNGWPAGTPEESAPVASNAKGVIEINVVPASSAPACQFNCG